MGVRELEFEADFEKTPNGMTSRGESGEDAGDFSSVDDEDSTVDTVVVGDEFVEDVAEVEDKLSCFWCRGCRWPGEGTNDFVKLLKPIPPNVSPPVISTSILKTRARSMDVCGRKRQAEREERTAGVQKGIAGRLVQGEQAGKLAKMALGNVDDRLEEE
ncbi:hypothetical protein Dda_6417 [Drechslerella dactyloides]|uniref:Uncharacterized protein n=1 Tax=Drechslerella dactyloides TaxID=74499 RepID=A0AAD6IU51_DREDA|nr:hypothetical protein Dda_6417 [Drechslerella dactyloides]